MDGYESEDFHPPIEPMVIIRSQEEEDDNYTDKSAGFMTNVGSDVTIFKVKKTQHKAYFGATSLKNSLYENNYHNGSVQKRIKNTGTRLPVRRLSKDELLNAVVPYTKRKSSPLEKCPICLKFFRRMKTHLIKHEVMQNQDEGLICEVCRKVFNSQRYPLEANRNSGSKDKISKGFFSRSDRSNLHIHMRTHTGDKPYICEVCNKSFSQSCNLVNHVRVHTGEKPFKCPHCERAFTQSGNLNNHIRLHTDEKPFKCHFCDKAFVQSGNLNSHIRNNHKVKDFTKHEAS